MQRTLRTYGERWSRTESLVWNESRPADEVRTLRSENVELRRRLRRRAVAIRAQGVVMALVPCSSEHAKDFLADLADHCGLPVRDVAQALVGTFEGRPLTAKMQRELGSAVVRLKGGAPA
ncbi:ANTAR domain-containing protein [Streptomyces sp. BV286]|uniref:ANTAR domain-containing protein n=1 Tax=unclassified Streptomyces TaxID=2593676 RepID=UPI001C2EDCAF|nr:ANTAR domain-containing protein [Streptomyces sp. BV286]MBV1941933.1 ANTAR domain-containing protein [Streptomyces sp. BV286]